MSTSFAPAPTNRDIAKLRYHGTGSALFGLMFVNGLLSIVTLGIYSFWGRNKVRQFHHSNTEMDGDRFAYHGTGGELLRGYLKMVGVIFGIGLIYAVLLALLGGTGKNPDPATAVFLSFGLQLVIWGLIGLAINGARRYRFSRSSFRAIRFSYHGKPLEFIGIALATILLASMTFGFYSAYGSEQRRAFLVNNVRFGTEPFIYESEPKPLFNQWVKAFFLTLPTLGLSWAWYAAYQHRHQWGHTTMRGGRFVSTVTGGGMLGLAVTNILLVVVTVGIAVPWVLARTMRYHLDNLTLVGTVDWASIQQQNATAGASMAEGVADSFNLDVGIGL